RPARRPAARGGRRAAAAAAVPARLRRHRGAGRVGAVLVPGRPVPVRDQAAPMRGPLTQPAPPVTGTVLPPVLVVSGTGTEVGKTVVTAAIAALAASHGRRVAVVKPAQTGEPPGLTGDLQVIRRLSGVT